MAINQAQPSGHLYGPPPVHVAFYYGSVYLGELRGGIQDVERVRSRLIEHVDMLESNSLDRHLKRYMLLQASPRFICGNRVMVRGRDEECDLVYRDICS